MHDAEFKAEIEAAIAGDDPEELLGVIIDLALGADDADWAEDCCLRLAQHPNTDVRGNAVIGFAHLAERFGGLNREKVLPVLEAARSDPKEYVRDQAEAALEALAELVE